MIRLATVFSGIGAIEHALQRMQIKNEIIFACDNGDVSILTKKIDMNIDEIGNELKALSKIIKKIQFNDEVEDLYKGISPEFRGTISHLVMHGVNNRVDAYMELFLRHPLSIRRYYRQFDY